MKRRNAVLAIGAAAAAPRAALAQSGRPIKRIGFFNLAPAHVDAPYLTAFHAGMVEQGLLDGRDYVVEVRSANGNMQAGPAVAAELVATRPDLILGMGDPSIKMLLQATKTIPIVFGVGMDPIGTGLVASLRQPGGNATGLTTMATELWPKRVQLLKEAFPKVTHIGMLFMPDFAGSVTQAREIEAVAARLGMRASALEIRQAADIEPAFKRAAALGVQALAVPFDAVTNSHSRVIAEQLIRLKLPSMFGGVAYVEAGGLMSYGAAFSDNFRRAASHADRIFKGAKPGDLPVEQPTRFELVVNMKTAKAIGVTFRESIMVGVDRVIE